MPNARHLEEGSKQDDNDVRLPPVRVGKEPRIAVADEKLASGKLLSASTKLVQDELLPGSSKARSLEDSSDQDEDDIRLQHVRAGKGPKTAAVNKKPASGKLSSVSTELVLGIGLYVRAKKVLTLKTG